MGQDPVCRREITVTIDGGLHLRPLSQVAQLARGFSCEVHIVKDGQAVNAKEVFDLMTLNAARGSTLVLETAGDGASEALERLAALFESNFEDGTDETCSSDEE
ncbi:MAG TPA: HPr family phosphocarrier protein [Planctomycetaceae bacterium]|nr:HPr family phosphocarrier protein [Planctomycetaceae bacterium]